jgi:hypothetical protein
MVGGKPCLFNLATYSTKESRMDQLDKDFQAFMDALADDGVIRKVIIDGVNFYFSEGDPLYKEYLARKEEGISENHSRYA